MIQGSTAVVVLGMRRGGGSLVSQCFYDAGVFWGNEADLLRPGGQLAPSWENARIVAAQESFMRDQGILWYTLPILEDEFFQSKEAWALVEKLKSILRELFEGCKLWGVKDPATCLLGPLWVAALSQLRVDSRYVICIRHPHEVVASLQAQLGFSRVHGLMAWTMHTLQACRFTKAQTRAVVDYGELFKRPVQTMEAVYERIGLEWSNAAAGSIKVSVRPELRRQYWPQNEEGERRPFDNLAVRVYELLAKGAKEPAALDTEEFDEEIEKSYAEMVELASAFRMHEIVRFAVQGFSATDDGYSDTAGVWSEVGSGPGLVIGTVELPVSPVGKYRFDPAPFPCIIDIHGISVAGFTEGGKQVFEENLPWDLKRFHVNSGTYTVPEMAHRLILTNHDGWFEFDYAPMKSTGQATSICISVSFYIQRIDPTLYRAIFEQHPYARLFREFEEFRIDLEERFFRKIDIHFDDLYATQARLIRSLAQDLSQGHNSSNPANADMIKEEIADLKQAVEQLSLSINTLPSKRLTRLMRKLSGKR